MQNALIMATETTDICNILTVVDQRHFEIKCESAYTYRASIHQNLDTLNTETKKFLVLKTNVIPHYTCNVYQVLVQALEL